MLGSAEAPPPEQMGPGRMMGRIPGSKAICGLMTALGIILVGGTAAPTGRSKTTASNNESLTRASPLGGVNEKNWPDQYRPLSSARAAHCVAERDPPATVFQPAKMPRGGCIVFGWIKFKSQRRARFRFPSASRFGPSNHLGAWGRARPAAHFPPSESPPHCK